MSMHQLFSRQRPSPAVGWALQCDRPPRTDPRCSGGTRTRDFRVMSAGLCQLSYGALRTPSAEWPKVVAETGFEPATSGLWAQRATKLLYSAKLLLARVVRARWLLRSS